MITRQVTITIATSSDEAVMADLAQVEGLIAQLVPQRVCLRCLSAVGDTWLPVLHAPCTWSACRAPEDHHQPLTVIMEVSS